MTAPAASGLSAADAAALDREGYVLIRGAVDSAWLERLRAAFERAMASAQPAAAGPQTGTRHAAELSVKDPAFARIPVHPAVLAAAQRVLGRPFSPFQLGGRDPLPGFGQQGLHIDWLPRSSSSEPYSLVTAIWLLDDFTETNGATRRIPRSHLDYRPLPKSYQSPEARHSDQRLIVAPAGSVLIFNGHLQHGGTRNRSKGPRRVLQSQFLADDRRRPGASDVSGDSAPGGATVRAALA